MKNHFDVIVIGGGIAAVEAIKGLTQELDKARLTKYFFNIVFFQ